MASSYNRRSGSSGSNRPTVSGSSRSQRLSSQNRQPQVTAQAGGRGVAAPSDAPLTATRIGDLDRRSGKRSLRGSKQSGGKGKIIAIVAVVVALLLGIGGLALFNSNAFEIKNLSVKGADHLTYSEVSQLAAVPEGSTLLRVDADSIRARMLMDTWVEDVKVNRVFPDTLELVVKERAIKAVVGIASKDSKSIKQWAIAEDGMWLMPIPDKESEAGKATSEKIYEDAENVLHIEGVPYTASAEIGKYCTDSNVNNALNIVSGMTTDLAKQVKKVLASDADSTTLILENGIEIAFGTAENIREKERVCLELMKQFEGEVAYINVRTVDRPTWRSL